MSNPASKIEPALSAEEWMKFPVRRELLIALPDDGVHYTPSVGVSFGWPLSGINIVAEHSCAGLDKSWTPRIVALANAALPDDDPRKITRTMVAAIEDAALGLEEEVGPHPDIERLRGIADALASYLPPETP